MKEVNPNETTRSYAYYMWMKAPMPMVTLFKTLDISNLVRISRNSGLKFNMLMCWCIGRAARQVEEFYILPVGDKLIKYDNIAVNTIVTNKNGGINSCDIFLSEDLRTFNADYLYFTNFVSESCNNYDLTDCMVIGTSALVQCDIIGAVGMYSGVFNNPFMIWGKYQKKWFKKTLTISFQFHHVQMDGAHAVLFLDLLQKEVHSLNVQI